MADKILLNNELYHFSESDLPCLITYAPKTGGSHFTVTLVADLFLQGSKILFLTAYPMAKENFLEQVGEDHSKIIFVDSPDDLEKAKDFQVIILESGNENLFLEVSKNLPDLQERVILIKNMEVFSEKVFEVCVNLEKVILSGDIDTTSYKEKIIKKDFKTIIAFSQSEINLPIQIPSLEKYVGYLSSQDKSGLVAIEKSI
ncbi:MAG: hypothetical protein KBD14_02045 [Candidatus Pacebacteria bacterium]|nr:hypothetical protein [Candidatus Paceibacterota bacterium]